eukprot:scaffold7828_cov1008-Prasinococcus_capsulatus_cf.AAC.1
MHHKVTAPSEHSPGRTAGCTSRSCSFVHCSVRGNLCQSAVGSGRPSRLGASSHVAAAPPPETLVGIVFGRFAVGVSCASGGRRARSASTCASAVRVLPERRGLGCPGSSSDTLRSPVTPPSSFISSFSCLGNLDRRSG